MIEHEQYEAGGRPTWREANVEGTYLREAYMEEVYLREVHLEGGYLEGGPLDLHLVFNGCSRPLPNS